MSPFRLPGSPLWSTIVLVTHQSGCLVQNALRASRGLLGVEWHSSQPREQNFRCVVTSVGNAFDAARTSPGTNRPATLLASSATVAGPTPRPISSASTPRGKDVRSIRCTAGNCVTERAQVPGRLHQLPDRLDQCLHYQDFPGRDSSPLRAVTAGRTLEQITGMTRRRKRPSMLSLMLPRAQGLMHRPMRIRMEVRVSGRPG